MYVDFEYIAGASSRLAKLSIKTGNWDLSDMALSEE